MPSSNKNLALNGPKVDYSEICNPPSGIYFPNIRVSVQLEIRKTRTFCPKLFFCHLNMSKSSGLLVFLRPLPKVISYWKTRPLLARAFSASRTRSANYKHHNLNSSIASQKCCVALKRVSTGNSVPAPPELCLDRWNLWTFRTISSNPIRPTSLSRKCDGLSRKLLSRVHM